LRGPRGRHAPGAEKAIKLFAEPSIRRQLVFWLLLPLTVALIVSALIGHRLATDFVTAAYDRALYDSALDISRRLRYRNGHLFVDLPPAAAEMFAMDDLDYLVYEVLTETNEFVAGRQGLPRPDTAPSRRPQYYYGSYGGQLLRLTAVRATYDTFDYRARALVIVGETVIKREALTQEILLGVGLSQLALTAMMVLAVYLGVGHGLLPLRRLRQQIESRSDRDLTPISETQIPREVLPVVRALNELLQRLQRAIQWQRRFVADAAHQLRTPLAGLKTHAELALREKTVEGMRERVLALTQATDRSAHLAHQLLSLARAEPAASAAQDMRLVDLNDVARETTADWVPRAVERDIDLGFNASDRPIHVQGNTVLLREALANLIDNAIRYNRPGGHVTVSTERVGSEARLLIEDDGLGIPEQDRERVFERFQRLADSSADGCGLGLAIVREIAQMHYASVSLDQGSGGVGTRVCVRLPLSAPASKAD
jgi:two-component system sensor histidine kinase TctE